MRIVYLHQYFKTPDMSGGTRSYEMARRLVAWGHEVHIITSTNHKSSGWSTELIDGIHVHWLSLNYSNKMSFLSRVKAFLYFAVRASFKAARIKSDVILATSTPLTIVLPGLYASWKTKAPMVFEVRDLWPAVPIAIGAIRNKWLIRTSRWLEKVAYEHAAQIIALAPGMADDIITLGIEKEKISIIPNGCDLKLFQKAVSTTFTKNDKIILYTGTIGSVNDVEYIVKLAKELKDSYPNEPIKFFIVGDGKNYKNIYSLAQDLEVLDVNVFLKGELLKKDVIDVMQSAVATIVTYGGPNLLYRDSVSNKFFDSIAAGKLVFANYIGFSTEIAQHVGSCVILSNKDIQEAASTVVAHLNNDSFLENAQIQGLKLAQDLFNRDDLAKDLETVLSGVVKGKSHSQIGEQYRKLWVASYEITND